MKFYQKKVEDITSHFKTDIEQGLTKSEANKKLEKFGPNVLPQKKPTSAIVILLRQFLSPLIFVLLFATLFSLAIGKIKDSIVIFIAVFLNTIIGFIQEWKAEKTAEKLKSYEVTYCNVIRDGKSKEIKAKELVPGDIIILSAGLKIPADVRLAKVTDFTVDESLLTGESKPVKKGTSVLKEDLTVGDRVNMAFSGTTILNGKAHGIVVKTGKDTEIGQIAELIGQTKEKSTPLQQQLKKLSWILGAVCLIIVTMVLLLGLFRGMPFYEIVMIGIALAVSAIPEGLLVSLTVILAIGMQRMLKRNALVRHLVAAETLGSVSVICTDKTGTLTKGKMEVEKIITPELTYDIGVIRKNKKEFSLDKELKNILTFTILNNDAQFDAEKENFTGNPTEIALLKLANTFDFDVEKIKKQNERIDEIPFSSKSKFMATINQFDETKKIIVKGAPEKILDMCKKNNRELFKNLADEMAREGLRILAIATKNINADELEEDELVDLNLLGIIGIKDPLREQAQETVKELQDAGVRIVLVTGDHQSTAKNIADSAGISNEDGTLTGKELENFTEDELAEKIKNINIFARVEPKHKIKIVHAWQEHNESVAMIGDGVNDAPALKAADIGVALGSGSEVSHEISDMVLLDDNLSTIDAAVKEGRTIFDNIRKVATYLLSDAFGEIILISFAIIFNYPIPILATQILWINLISDGFPGIALTTEPPEAEVMNEPPRKKDEPILNKEIKTIIFGTCIITDIIIFILYIYLLSTNLDFEHIRTIMFTTLAINSLFFVFPIKSLRKSIFKINVFSNLWLIFAIFAGFIAQLVVLYIPIFQDLFNTVALSLFDWGIVLIFSLTKTFSIEMTKLFFIKK